MSGDADSAADLARVERMLGDWLRSAEQNWHTRTDADGLEQGWYGSGYTGWGTQTCWQYLGATGALATHATDAGSREWALRRALAALRYLVATHTVGFQDAEDGRRWGRTWISVLGVERAGWVIDELGPRLEPRYRDGLRDLLIDEAQWQAESHERGGITGIHGSRWNSEGKNWPESNLWNGAHLWRTAERYPEHPRAGRWRERATHFLINAVSVAEDATSETVLDGVPVSEAHAGANFFDSYALDHHGYLNVGYMVICASNAALAMLDLQSQGRQVPAALMWHQDELWRRIRPLIGPDARLLRIGGDARVRYAYCQEYLLPALLLAQSHLGDPGAARLAHRYLDLVERESGDVEGGSLYGHRLALLATNQPYYRARLETDRACVLGTWWHHSALGTARAETVAPNEPSDDTAQWSDDEHGFAFTRGPGRVASVSWRAASGSQVLALPTDATDMAEWSLNLCPVLRFEGDGTPASPTESPTAQRNLGGYTIETFPGGFLSAGRVEEGCALSIAEGWRGSGPVADTWVVVAALPDDATVVGLHLSKARDLRPPLLSAHALNLLIPDDVHNDHRRSVVALGDHALCIDERLDVVADRPLSVVSHPVREGSGLRSIAVEQIAAGARRGGYWAGAGETILEAAWAVRVREPGQVPPRVTHEVDGEGRHSVDVAVPAGSWRLSLDPAAEDRPTWGERVGAITLTRLTDADQEESR